MLLAVESADIVRPLELNTGFAHSAESLGAFTFSVSSGGLSTKRRGKLLTSVARKIYAFAFS